MMQKRRLVCLMLVSLVVWAQAELYKPARFIELGTEATGGISNNYFQVSDILTEKITFDLTKIAKEMPDEGLSLDMYLYENTFLQFNLNKKFRLGLFATLEGSGYLNIASELFDVFGKGYSVGDTLDVSLSGYGDIFATLGVSFHTMLFEKYGITITPSYVVPLAYIDELEANFVFSSTTSGNIYAEARVPLEMYTATDIQKLLDEDFSGYDIADMISESMGAGGFDLTLAGERNVLKRLDVGVFTRIPIVPGRLRHKVSRMMYVRYEAENILDTALNSDDDIGTLEKDTGETTYTTTDSKYVWRPFKLGIEAAWQPFGKWCVFRPKFALVIRNPYTWSTLLVYPEYALDARFTLFNIVGVNVGTAFENRVFVQRFGFMLNARVLQIDVNAMLRGANFVNSFSKTGAGVSVGLRIGF